MRNKRFTGNDTNIKNDYFERGNITNKKSKIRKRYSKINYSGNYESFLEFIKRGIFAMPYCKKCKKNTWPPTDFCPICFNIIVLCDLKEENGKLIEILYSFVGKKKIIGSQEVVENSDLIGLVDFDGVKLLGLINKKSYNNIILLNKNELPNSIKSLDYSSVHVKLIKCGIYENKIYYEFELVSVK